MRARGRTRRALARLARWLRPPRVLRPTRAGWIFFVLTLSVGFAALNTGNNLLYLVLSLMLAFLVLSGVLSESALRGVGVRRSLPREIFEGQAARVVLEIENRQRRVPSFAVAVEDRVREADGGERAAGRAFALRIGPDRTETRVYRFEASRRGSLSFTSFKVSTRFPFGLFVKSLAVECPMQALVYPAIHRAPVPEREGCDESSGDSRSERSGNGSEVGGVRDFEAGDSARRIAWRATLRSGSLVARDTEREQRSEVEVQIRTRHESEGEHFEQAVRRAASSVVAALDSGLRVRLRTDELRVNADGGARQRGRLLSVLARLQPGPAATLRDRA
ncbi:MAG: DUF58 domain-containing protein [Myxococcota bacterium]